MDRKKAVESALASIEMEGIKLPPSALKIFDEIAEGKITTDDARYIQYVTIESWKKTNPEWFCQEEPEANPHDPYTYKGTDVLINKLGIINGELLKIVEGFFSATGLIDLRLEGEKTWTKNGA